MSSGKKKGGLAAFAKKKTAAAAVTEAELLVKPAITVEDVMRLREPCAGKHSSLRHFYVLSVNNIYIYMLTKLTRKEYNRFVLQWHGSSPSVVPWSCPPCRGLSFFVQPSSFAEC